MLCLALNMVHRFVSLTRGQTRDLQTYRHTQESLIDVVICLRVCVEGVEHTDMNL